MKRVADLANDLAQPMYVAMAVFSISAVFVVLALVRRMAELATDWRLDGSWHLGVSQVIGCLIMLVMLLAGYVEARRKVRS